MRKPHPFSVAALVTSMLGGIGGFAGYGGRIKRTTSWGKSEQVMKQRRKMAKRSRLINRRKR